MKGKRWIITIAGATGIVLLLRGFLLTSYIVPSTGMENALYQGDRILVNKWSYGLRTPFMQAFSYHRWRERAVKTGDIVLFNNPAGIIEPVIDRREVFIGRCIATPGDVIAFDTLYNPTSSMEKAGPDRKSLYCYPPDKEHVIDSLLRHFSITSNTLMGSNELQHVRSFSCYEAYLLTQALNSAEWLTPFHHETEATSKRLTIPGKGIKVKIEPWNALLYCNTLILHEQKNAHVNNDTLFIDGKATFEHTFFKDYYWMASNNAVSFQDSRLFGFVPHDHLIGKATFVWYSKSAYTGLFEGYRWGRFFRKAY